MRLLSNFLLFENVLDNLNYSDPYVSLLATQLFKPNVTIVQQNCGTTLGKRIPVNLTCNGLVRMDWNGTLNLDGTIPVSYKISKADIQSWLGRSIYETYVRDLHYCTSVGGVCAACYAATMQTAAPEVGSIIQIPNSYVTHIDSFMTSTSTNYNLTVEREVFDYANIFLDNVLLEEGTDYTISDKLLTLSQAPTFGNFLTVNEIAISNKPFLSYVGKLYGGDFLGIEPIFFQDILLPHSVIDRNIQPSQLNQITTALEKLGIVDQTYLNYCEKITNKVERAIILLILYTLYTDVQS